MADGRLTFDTKLDSSGLTSGLKSVGSTAIKAVAGITTAGAAAAASIAKMSVGAYASYEQLVGGVDTLFKKSSKQVQNYADNAYKTAGLSANAYMDTVTSFSASLLQSLDNDTDKAAKAADKAIIDMSDNANKMGTSMEAIQNAYQGFAKQNYTMLDNLKLGYGGTKTEMERLLSDAEKLKKAQGENVSYSIDSFADIVEAIHVVQDEMGITGTTAKEASTTIEGSVNSAKAAWENLLVGIANDNADFDTLVDNFVEAVGTAASNILPRVEISLNGVSKLIKKAIPIIMNEIPGIIETVLPELVKSGTNMALALIQGLKSTLPKQFQPLLELLSSLIKGSIPFLKNEFNNLVKVLNIVTKTVANVVKYFQENKTAAVLLRDAILWITSAIAAYKIAIIASNAVCAISNGLIKVQTAYTLLQQGATLKATIAQLGFNAAMNANPIGIVIGLLGGLVTLLVTATALFNSSSEAVTAEDEAHQKKIETLKAETEAIREQNEAYCEKIAQAQESAQSDVEQMAYITDLADELMGLADEAGKVKDADKARADFILNELNNALGTEYEMTGNQIGQYDKLRESIYKTIDAKTAELLLADYQETYTEAAKKSTQATEDFAAASEELGKVQQEVSDAASDLAYWQGQCVDNLFDYQKLHPDADLNDYVAAMHNVAEKTEEAEERQKEANETLKDTQEKYDNAKEKAETYYAEMIQWQSAYQASAKGNAEEAEKILTTSIDEFKEIGGYITDGVAEGMSTDEAKTKVREAAKKIGEIGWEAMRKELGIHSPSKKFKWIGQMCVEGFEEPLENYNPYDTLNASMKANKNTLKMNYNAGLSLKGYVDYDRIGEKMVNALEKAGLTVSIGKRDFGRIVREVM